LLRLLRSREGTALLFDVKERLAALALAAFLVPASVMAHDFWAYHGAECQGQLVNFTKNLAMLGGLLFVVFRGADSDMARSQRHELP
jgi:putative oxidoreductase